MWPTKTSVSLESAFQVKHDKRKKEKSKFKSFSATTVLLCIFVLSYSVIPSVTGAYFARFLADLFDKLAHNKFTHRYIVFFIVVFLCHNCCPVLFTRRVVKNFTLLISSGAWMFRRTFNVHVSQNLFSTRFWATLNLMETFWTHLFSNPPPPRKKNVLLANVLTSTIFYEISKHFAIDKATCLNTQVHFYFSCLRMQSVQDSEWLRSTQQSWSRQKMR